MNVFKPKKEISPVLMNINKNSDGKRSSKSPNQINRSYVAIGKGDHSIGKDQSKNQLRNSISREKSSPMTHRPSKSEALNFSKNKIDSPLTPSTTKGAGILKMDHGIKAIPSNNAVHKPNFQNPKAVIYKPNFPISSNNYTANGLGRQSLQSQIINQTNQIHFKKVNQIRPKKDSASSIIRQEYVEESSMRPKNRNSNLSLELQKNQKRDTSANRPSKIINNQSFKTDISKTKKRDTSVNINPKSYDFNKLLVSPKNNPIGLSQTSLKKSSTPTINKSKDYSIQQPIVNNEQINDLYDSSEDLGAILKKIKQMGQVIKPEEAQYKELNPTQVKRIETSKQDKSDQTNVKGPVFSKVIKPQTFQDMNTSPFVAKKREHDNLKQSNLNPQIQSNFEGVKPVPVSQAIPKFSGNMKVNKKIINSFDLMRAGYQGPGLKKNNQDNYFHYKNFLGDRGQMYLGVCDGHGMNGHDVSLFLRNTLPHVMEDELKSNKLSIEKEFYDSCKQTVNSLIVDVFLRTNLNLNSKVDTIASGSTCCSLFLTPEHVISINCGDSRAVLGKKIGKEWKNHDLSIDHKPDDPIEKERILRCGGRVQPHRDDYGGFIGPSRVWLKDQDIPGLAMSRSFGDKLAASVGTTSEPEVIDYTFTNDDKFLIVASDGVWEFITSSEIVEFIKDFYIKGDAKGCCEFLLKEASARWIQEEQVIDDISMILLFFD